MIEINSNRDLSQIDYVVRSERSNAVIDDLTINNLSATKLNTGLSIHNSSNVIVNRPKITGIKENEPKGYGISISQASEVVINDGYIPEGRHQ